jgi:formate hydrogenlyase subunit 6/NADH:ubiquinone oxidoreductase subunit I
MRTIPIGEALTPTHRALAYDHVSGIIEKGQSFTVSECVCKKEQRLLNNACDHSLDVCLVIGPLPGLFDEGVLGRPISKQEAYAVLDKAEQAGLVHMTANLESDHNFICNCCGCCCQVLKGMTKLGMAEVVNSDFHSQIDAEECTGCGICATDVCQVDAIAEQEGAYQTDRARCLGCGNCVNVCPVEAIRLVRKRREDRVPPLKDADTFLDEIARQRGVDYSAYK